MAARKWWEFINDMWKFIKKHNESPRDWDMLMHDAAVIINRLEVFKKIIFDVIEIWENEERRD